MHLLGRWPCVKTEHIVITIKYRDSLGFVGSVEIDIEGIRLNFDEASCFAWRDGFRPDGSSESNPLHSLFMMARFWDGRFEEGKWAGQIVHWSRPDLLPVPQSANAVNPQPAFEA
jgi:hypothetical protein